MSRAVTPLRDQIDELARLHHGMIGAKHAAEAAVGVANQCYNAYCQRVMALTGCTPEQLPSIIVDFKSGVITVPLEPVTA